MIDNLLDPTILCFVVGFIAGLVKSDLRLPASSYEFVSMYLLLALGFKGGVQIAETETGSFFIPLLGTLFIGMFIPVVAFTILRNLGKFDRPNAGSIAAHYGSVSAVTFATAITYAKTYDISYDAYVVALMVVLEIPALCIGIFLAKGGFKLINNKKKLLGDVFLGKSIFLLAGGLIIGMVAGKEKMKPLNPLFLDCFKGFLALFLLELGVLTAKQIQNLKKTGIFLLFFATLMPLLSGSIGLAVAYFCGMTSGSAALMAIISASSSYIAAPSAMKIAVPEANPVYSLTPSLAVTFPLNITLGIPFFFYLAQRIYGY